MIRGILICCAFLGLVACKTVEPQAVSQKLAPAPLPAYKVGDSYTYSLAVYTREWKVLGLDGDIVDWQGGIFGKVTAHKAFMQPRITQTGDVAPAGHAKSNTDFSKLFPLEVGKSISGTGSGVIRGNSFTFERECWVDAQERITVPAGSFDTFKVMCAESEKYSSSSSTDRKTWWYAPSLDIWVARREYGHMAELLSYKRM
ncbi:MAG: hypothetical protein HN725_14120 [Alphaproteobacteria bacterium]|nr:hypothetical protein [Alphaproteobacteria bacterium]MBT4082254.1 hypothetical protein [Alphaproteobacteria bacterium]MBT4542336.1 hypothetical protein [Alphaproteobacteria bacterium]MBT7746423.1 hypothetical protein [Alphaproteobacteria bacterium]